MLHNLTATQKSLYHLLPSLLALSTVSFKDKDQQDRYDKAHFISWLKNRVATKGLEGLDFNISIKSKDMDEEMWNEVTNTKPKDPNEKEEAPF